MRSKSCSPEGRGQEPREEEEEEEAVGEEVTNRKLKVQREEKGRKAELPELSRKQLLHLLGVMEGEIQVATPTNNGAPSPFLSCSAENHREPCSAAATCRSGAD